MNPLQIMINNSHPVTPGERFYVESIELVGKQMALDKIFVCR